MASFIYNQALADVFGGDLDLDGAVLSVALVTSTYNADPSDEIADSGGGSDMESGELNISSGYVRGYGGSGRLILANRVITIDAVNDTVTFTNTVDFLWSSLPAGGTIVAAVLLIEDFLGSAGNDTETRLVSYNQLAQNMITDGSDIQIAFPSGLIVGTT